jgi:hypothetical protein
VGIKRGTVVEEKLNEYKELKKKSVMAYLILSRQSLNLLSGLGTVQNAVFQKINCIYRNFTATQTH